MDIITIVVYALIGIIALLVCSTVAIVVHCARNLKEKGILERRVLDAKNQLIEDLHKRIEDLLTRK